ncbi:MAG: SRPBCC domain-containing protein [Alphaproteobacteria bacterium]|nr:SRPBCC domain-containing protein [Alphaproteobacteria bacterium]
MSASLADDELLLTRTFDAPASLVFALWTDPAHFRNWMGPGSYTCTDCDIDLRVGGSYRARIASADDPNNWFGGVYREIVPHERLVFTFKWDNGPSSEMETLVTITFREHDGKTVMTFHQTPFLDAARRDSHVGGWTSAFDKAVAYAEHIAKEGKSK